MLSDHLGKEIEIFQTPFDCLQPWNLIEPCYVLVLLRQNGNIVFFGLQQFPTPTY